MIENFGPVSSFEFDTASNFHLIVGENNVGKSYALSVFYALVKSINFFKSYSYQLNMLRIMDDNEYSDVDEKHRFETLKKSLKLPSGDAKDADVSGFFLDFAISALNESLARKFTENIRSSYSESASITNKNNDKEASVKIVSDGFEFSLSGDLDGFRVSDFKSKKKFIVRKSKQNRIALNKMNSCIIYYVVDSPYFQLDLVDSVGMQFEKSIHDFFVEFSDSVYDVHYLPASRSGLYQALSAFGQIVAQLSQSRFMLTSKLELPGISKQLSDYFIKLSSIKVSSKSLMPEFDDIAEHIENEVLKGKIEFDEDDKKIYYKPLDQDLRLDLSVTSSMVSEVAPIVAYIRHILSESVGLDKKRKNRRRNRKAIGNQLLIIEEPEAHLHPSNQIKLIKLYAKLSKLGVSVFMTSHSNYVFNTISNLVISGELDKDVIKCHKFELSNIGGSGKPLDIDEYGIDDENFVDASEILFEEKMNLLSSLEKEDD